jgi:type VI secretion system secreted protein VgrG
MDFETAVGHVLLVEGGYSNRAIDRGGPTNFGITIATLSKWRKKEVTAEDVKNLTIAEAKQIYRAWYWDSIKLDQIKCGLLALCLFDQGVNKGPESVVLSIQKLCNKTFGGGLKVDGDLGPKTAEYLNSLPPMRLIREFLQDAEKVYISIVRQDVSQLGNLDGWINRVHNLQDMIFSEQYFQLKG